MKFKIGLKRFFIISCLWLLAVAEAVAQQLTGQVTDADGEAIPYATVAYKGHHEAVSSNMEGRFSIARHEGWALTVSSLGYKTVTIHVGHDTPGSMKVKLEEESRRLNEVVVSEKRGRYRRKDNPAVELMRRVIAAKKRNRLENHDYYEYDKYQKLTMSLNDIKPSQLDSKYFKRRQYLLDQVEVSPWNHKLTLPISMTETVTRRIYRKNPREEKDIVEGQKDEGIGSVLQTGEMLNTVLKDIFTDVDIYDDHVRLLQYPFPSPIGNTAISFYHFYIEDTVYVDRDLCYHLQFIPANSQDFGFRGELYVMADSSLHVRRCNLYMPKKTGVNWVDNMIIEQEFSKLDNGEWVLTRDDMVAELHAVNLLPDMLVVRNTRIKDYNFEPLPNKLFKGKAKTRMEAEALNRDEDYWNHFRDVELTKSEKGMANFIDRMKNSKGWKWVSAGLKLFMENYAETSTKDGKSKFDLGPVNTFLSKNYVDNIRLRLAGRTTAQLNPHWFWDGYGAYGTKSGKWYYGSNITYALNKKKRAPFEFPRRNITFESTYDVMSPSDKNLQHNKDNIFMTIRATTQDEMYFYNRQQLTFTYETEGGLALTASAKTESNETAGELHYYRLDGTEIKKIRMGEVSLGLDWNPNVTYVNTKQQRIPVNLDQPKVYINHTMGMNHFLGGQFKSNTTELGFYKRQWLGSWGCIDFHVKAEAQWNQVPFPMLLLPPINLSFFEHENNFNMMRDWEFLNDRQVFWAACWDMNGKILNRIPMIKKLKWREYFAIKGLWGNLTNKNNPTLTQNQGSLKIYKFPEGAHVMTNQPYWEAVVGVRNIFKFFTVECIRRITYLNNPDTHKWGLRFGFDMSF